jgi:hypothetical protein
MEIIDNFDLQQSNSYDTNNRDLSIASMEVNGLE